MGLQPGGTWPTSPAEPNRVSCCLSQSSYLINDLHLEGRAPIRPPPPQHKGRFHLDKKSVKFGETQMGCVRLGNLDLEFKIRISDLQSNAKSEKGFQRWDICFYRSIKKSEKRFEKLSLRTAVLHAHAYLAKRRPLFTRIVLQILFRISQSNGKKEIHEIRIWIS